MTQNPPPLHLHRAARQQREQAEKSAVKTVKAIMAVSKRRHHLTPAELSALPPAPF